MSAPQRKKIGGYDVVEPLDQGGMGVVYLAEQPELERRVVIKALRKDLVQNPQIDERFRREAEAQCRVHHQNVVAVYDCFIWRGERFIAQEYVEGADLEATLSVVRRFEPRVGALLALELARGLEEIHQREIVHRDLKPPNVLLGKGGEVKVADFGIALESSGERLTQTGHAVGTPPYMSPEQLLGERVDSRSDVFAFGVLLYEMLAGEPPFAEGDPEQDEPLIRRIQNGCYVPLRRVSPLVPRWLAKLVRDCLRPKPGKRPQTMAAVRAVIERKLSSVSPVQCRRELSEWLWDRKVFQAGANETVMAPAMPKARRKLPLPSLRVAAAFSLCAALIAGVVGFDREGLPALPELALPELSLPELPSLQNLLPGPAEPAVVHIEATPWARVQIDDRPAFKTPSDGPISLPPGPHKIAFEHPEFGRVERTVDVQPGEERTITHTFQKE